ncbi:hypothetical protein ACEQ8H_005394 [Pleosporales sp. CAS-2024a]
MNAYLQRADDFIQQQIYKYEQKLQGRRHYHYTAISDRMMMMPPRQGPPAPKGWSQEFDPQCRRWYYLEQRTGRAQWDPPSFFHTRRPSAPPRAPPPNTSRDPDMARCLQEEEEEEEEAEEEDARASSTVPTRLVAAPKSAG